MNFLSLGIGLSSAQISGGAVPVGTWILSTGLWADAGVWRDDQTWID